MTCHVYLFGCPGWYDLAGWRYAVKVGMAADPMARMGQLQTGNPHALELHFCFEFSDRSVAAAVEARFHRRSAAWRIGGEWFAMDWVTALHLLTIDVANVLRENTDPRYISAARKSCGMLRAAEIIDHSSGESQERCFEMEEARP